MDAAYRSELAPDLYAHLHAIAVRIHRERARGAETIAPTALAHEAWEKVARSSSDVGSRAHFLAVAAGAMRQILVDRARCRGRLKRGSNPARATLSGLGHRDAAFEVLELHHAIDKLAAEDSEAAEVVVLRTFGGLSVPEVAQVLGRSPRSIDRTWRFARAWLRAELG
jgi:RNA polymerase sigma-70 factor (ECF subfamily)